MIKGCYYLFFVLFILAPVFSEDNEKRSLITADEYCNNIFIFADVKSLESSYWIKQYPFSHPKYHDSNIEFNNEFIFLSGLRYLEVENMWTADYIESTDKYILDSSLSRIKGEYSYALNEQGNIENDFYIMKIVDNKLIVYDKITEQEAIYICHDKSLY